MTPATDPPDRSADSTHAASDDAQPTPPTRPSGLRNPQAAVRGVGAGALCIEALVLLLAIVPLHVLGVRHAGLAIGCVVGLAVLCVLLAGALRFGWAWWAGIAIQVLLIACGYFHVALAVIGVLFLFLWVYVISVRRTVLGDPKQ
ncbi:MAG TPA: DUF4233 domain-containing protein [Micromonosporaceae bacterium]|nr:DUF4233 domain-containing protein [Micromonosporaceae bacterium]